MSSFVKGKLIEIFERENVLKCKLTFNENEGSYYCYENENLEPQINIDLITLEQDNAKLKEKGVMCSLEDYCILTLLHEIGHAKDSTLIDSKKHRKSIRRTHLSGKRSSSESLNKYMKSLLKTELIAWEYARSRFDNLIAYSGVSGFCLNLYKESESELKQIFFS